MKIFRRSNFKTGTKISKYADAWTLPVFEDITHWQIQFLLEEENNEYQNCFLETKLKETVMKKVILNENTITNTNCV